MSRVTDLLKYHLKVKPIVCKCNLTDETTGKINTIYMVKSITRENQSYGVVFEMNEWSCDCPSFKYKTGTSKDGHCKHIFLVKFLLDKKMNILED